jgi:hypothetical protein
MDCAGDAGYASDRRSDDDETEIPAAQPICLRQTRGGQDHQEAYHYRQQQALMICAQTVSQIRLGSTQTNAAPPSTHAA